MFCDADHDLVRRETALPGFRTLLDEGLFLERLRRANPGSEVASARLRYLRYKPGTNCLAAYEVETGDGVVRVHGKAWRPGDDAKMAKHGGVEDGLSAGGIRGVRDAGEALVLGLFPWDAKLPSLPRWATAEARRAFFLERESLRGLAEASGWTVLNYKPERRLVARLDWADGSPAGVLKVHTDSGFAAAYAAACAIREGTRYGLPRVLGRSRGRAAVVLDWRDGEGLEQGMQARGAGTDPLRGVGAALAEFHGQAPVRLAEITRSQIASELSAHGTAVAWLLPGLAQRTESIGRRLARVVALAPWGCRVLHGDFYAKQVLLASGGVVFLDLDGARIGPAWLDLATFLAHLETSVVRGRISPGRASRLSAVFLEGYAEGADGVLPRGLSGLVACVLFTQLAHSFRCREGAWPEAIERSLERIEELLADAGSGTDAGAEGRPIPGIDVPEGQGPTPAPVGGVCLDPAMPFLERALDCGWMERRLGALGVVSSELAGHTLVSAALRRHKPGRRCLIEYRFEGARGSEGFVWVGKARARKGGGWSERVARALRDAGLRGDSCVTVPEPLGGIPELHLELQRGVPGDGVFGRLVGADGGALAARCAAAIARVHASGVTVPRTHTLADELAILRERLTRVQGSHPVWAGRVADVLAGCENLAASIDPVTPTLIHRDFYPDQLLVDGRRLWLLDLDLCSMGDPCLDHGNFLAHLIEWSVRHRGRPDALRECEQAYREVALASVGPGGAERLEVYLTLSVARHIQLATQFPDRRAGMPSLIAWCERRLAVPAGAWAS